MNQFELGYKIRQLRKAKHISIKAVSEATGLTSSFISQFERGKCKASMDSYMRILDFLNIKAAALYPRDASIDMGALPQTYITENKEASHYSSLSTEPLDEYLMSHPEHPVEIYRTRLKEGMLLSESYRYSNKYEFVTVIAGVLTVWINDERYELEKGAAMTISPREPRRWNNEFTEPCEMIWVIYDAPDGENI